MKITEFCLDNKITTLALTVVMIVAGLGAYQSMGRLGDPEFTIKDALITTQDLGAMAAATTISGAPSRRHPHPERASSGIGGVHFIDFVQGA